MSAFVAKRPQVLSNRLFTSPGNQFCMALVVALTVVLSASGACDTDNLGFAHRTLLWLLICMLTVWQAVVIRSLLARYLPNPYVCIALSIFVTVLVTAAEIHAMKFTPLLPKEPDPPLAFLLFVFPLVSPVALLALILTNRKTSFGHAGRYCASAPAREATKHLDGWPTERVIRVSVEDHYLSVHTHLGVTLIRGRMKDALAKLTATEGMQIHRSHWLAFDAIKKITRRGRDHRVFLKDACWLPVSRTIVAKLKLRLATASAVQDKL